MTHTPGPWRVETITAGDVYTSDDDLSMFRHEGQTLTLIIKGPNRIEKSNTCYIAEIDCDPIASRDLNKHPTQSDVDNARLIAAAPDMLATLQHGLNAAQVAVDTWESGNLAGAVRALDAWAFEAEATIAKAQPEEHGTGIIDLSTPPNSPRLFKDGFVDGAIIQTNFGEKVVSIKDGVVTLSDPEPKRARTK